MKHYSRRISGNGGVCQATWMQPYNGKMVRPTSSGTAATGGSMTSKSPRPAFPHFQTLHGRLWLSAFPSRCSRLALWLLSIKPSPSRILELFRICAREMFPKESDSIKQHFGKTGVQVGEFEEQLVIERTISANPFLVITQKHLGIT